MRKEQMELERIAAEEKAAVLEHIKVNPITYIIIIIRIKC